MLGGFFRLILRDKLRFECVIMQNLQNAYLDLRENYLGSSSRRNLGFLNDFARVFLKNRIVFGLSFFLPFSSQCLKKPD